MHDPCPPPTLDAVAVDGHPPAFVEIKVLTPSPEMMALWKQYNEYLDGIHRILFKRMAIPAELCGGKKNV